MPAPSRQHRTADTENSDETPALSRHVTLDDDSAEEDDDVDVSDADKVDAVEDVPHLVKKFVRYALACEYQRVPIRRAGITEKVIGKQREPFKLIFELAQNHLRTKFGMELVELPPRPKVTVREKIEQAAKKTKASTTTASYILRSTLPLDYRSPDIIPPSIVGSSSDEAAYIGLYTMIISLISLSPDGIMPHHKLDSLLKRLNIDKNTGIGTTSELLARMKKENYLHEHKVQGREDEAQASEWRVGPRGLVEVNTRAITGFVKQMYGNEAPEDLQKRLQRSLGSDFVAVSQVNPETCN